MGGERRLHIENGAFFIKKSPSSQQGFFKVILFQHYHFPGHSKIAGFDFVKV